MDQCLSFVSDSLSTFIVLTFVAIIPKATTIRLTFVACLTEVVDNRDQEAFTRLI